MAPSQATPVPLSPMDIDRMLTLYADTPGLTILRKLHQNLEVNCHLLEHWIGSLVFDIP